MTLFIYIIWMKEQQGCCDQFRELGPVPVVIFCSVSGCKPTSLEAPWWTTLAVFSPLCPIPSPAFMDEESGGWEPQKGPAVWDQPRVVLSEEIKPQAMNFFYKKRCWKTFRLIFSIEHVQMWLKQRINLPFTVYFNISQKAPPTDPLRLY